MFVMIMFDFIFQLQTLLSNLDKIKSKQYKLTELDLIFCNFEI